MTLHAEPECRARPRPARPEDVLAAVPLIVSSGPAAIDYGFATARHAGAAFVASACARGEGLFGWKNHTVALWRDEVVGIAAGYGAAACRRMNPQHAWHDPGVQPGQASADGKPGSSIRTGLDDVLRQPPPSTG